MKTMVLKRVKKMAALAAMSMALADGAASEPPGLLALRQGATSASSPAAAQLQVKDLTPVKRFEPPQHPPVVVIRDGVPQAKVYVTDPNPSRNLSLLVKELAEVVKLRTGAELDVLKQMPTGDAPAIVIGDCEASRAAGIAADRIPIEGFVVKTARNRVYLVGSTTPLPTVTNIDSPYSNDGTAWAVADFLERLVGVRWYWPVNAGGRSIVHAKTLEVPPAFYSDQPVFNKREFYPRDAYSVPRVGERGQPRNIQVGAGAIPVGVDRLDLTVLLAGLRQGNSCQYMIKVHNPQQVWKNQKLVDQHPELFNLKENGQRNFSQLCYGSQATLDFLLAGCEAFWDKKPAAMAPWNNHYVSWVTTSCVTVSPFDQPVDCHCEKCRKLYDPNAGNFGTGSKILGVFVKKFAAEVKRRWPDKKVLFLPYWNYTVCPVEISFPDNLEIQMCTEATALLRQATAREMMEQNLRAWSQKVGGKIQTWEYPHRVGDWCSAPLQYPHVLQDYYRHNRDLLVGSFLNGNTLTDWSKMAPTLYCYMKILWNPDVDVDAILQVMCDRMFGKAAGTAHDLLRLITDRWEKSPWSAEQIDWGKLDPPAYRDTWPPEVVAKMTQLWEKARSELKDDPAALQRFLYVTSSLESFPVEVQARAGAKPDRQ